MKNMKLFRAIGEVDSRYVEEAARPVRKMVWMPIVAAAACVALTVGLGFGLDRDPLPVEPAAPVTPSQSETTELTEPTESTQSTTEATEPTDTTAKPTTKDTTTTTTAKPTTTTTTEKPTATTTTAKPTTTTTTAKPTTKTEPTKTTEPYILVGGEEPKGEISTALIPSLNDRLVSKTLEEKMKEYRDVNAVFQVLVYSVRTQEDVNNCSEARYADEEWLSLEKQYEAACKALKEADKRLDDCEYPEDDPRRYELWQERNEAAEKKQEISNKKTAFHSEFSEKYYDNLKKERVSYASKFCKKGPISGYGPHGNGYYMELTADAINELVDRGGYSFKLTTEKEEPDRVKNA